jgi:hypothetical protein
MAPPRPCADHDYVLECMGHLPPLKMKASFVLHPDLYLENLSPALAKHTLPHRHSSPPERESVRKRAAGLDHYRLHHPRFAVDTPKMPHSSGTVRPLRPATLLHCPGQPSLLPCLLGSPCLLYSANRQDLRCSQRQLPFSSHTRCPGDQMGKRRASACPFFVDDAPEKHNLARTSGNLRLHPGRPVLSPRQLATLHRNRQPIAPAGESKDRHRYPFFYHVLTRADPLSHAT